MLTFHLGTHHPAWLARFDVPLFVSHRRLGRQKRFTPARTSWALDSGAFSEIAVNGEFTTTPRQYVAAIARYRDEIGRLDWAAPQDHMCEPPMLARSRIARTVPEAQAWTVTNYLTLRDLDPAVPVIPVLQGWHRDDYRRHADAYETAGVILSDLPLVGVGSVCRRQSTPEIGAIVASLQPLRLHGFGVKSEGLARYGAGLASADSMAWSYSGRRIQPCIHSPTRLNCGNCPDYALAWHARVVTTVNGRHVEQLSLW